MKRMGFLLSAVALSLLPLAALAESGMGFDDARHLLNRTSFAASVDDLNVFSRLSREQAADRLLAQSDSQPATPAPPWVDDVVSPRRVRAMSVEERRAFLRDQRQKGGELRSWWLGEMLITRSPLTEKMVLFWHNHFVSSLQKVRWTPLMYRQHVLLRRHALGNFGDFLHDVARDPAMVIYLDSASNRKGHPNENFAREVMELFTLGEGQYAEADVKDAARAFTGWGIDQDTGQFVFRAAAHDDGVKTVLGRTGAFDGDAVLDILLEQPQTAELIVAKLWREFVSPHPDRNEVARIARIFREQRYSIKAALRALLVSDAFYAPEHRAALIKSPVELIVGTLRQFGFETSTPTPFVAVSRRLGQDLFAPPNVKGWPGGELWINSSTLLARKQLLERLFRLAEAAPTAMAAGGDGAAPEPGAIAASAGERDRGAMDAQFDGDKWLARFKAGDPPPVRVVLPADPVSPVTTVATGSAMVRALVLDPVYQLK